MKSPQLCPPHLITAQLASAHLYTTSLLRSNDA